MTRITTNWLRRHLRREDGQTLVEYALIIMLIATALVVSLGALSDGLKDMFDSFAAVFAGFGSS